MELGAEVARDRRLSEPALGRYFIRTAKRRWTKFCMADSSGTSLTYGRTLVAGLLLSRWLQRHATDQKNIGLLLPSSVGGALANIAVTLSGKVAVNLNFTAGHESMRYAIERCGIRTILTSRVFLSKAHLEPLDGMVFLEDLMRDIGGPAKVGMFLLALVLPGWALKRLVVPEADPDALAAVIFSSGSTGVPKGVMLTHRNIIANIEAVAQVFEVEPTDVMIGILPFFHSFGFTGTLWFPIVTGFGVAYHPNPTDAKTIGELAHKCRATMLISTPTFCATYVRKCEPEQFANLRYAMVGAERLREPIAKAFKDKFGIDLLEGYGCTEMSPIVAVNAPNVFDRGERQIGVKPGTVGHPLPGVAAMIVDPETGEGPVFDREGLLLVKGPNLMAGYLDDPARTSEARRGDWYVTGDIAAHRRQRVHPDHRSAVEIQQDWRRDGAAHESRRVDQRAARRALRVGGHGHSRRKPRRAAGRVLYRSQSEPAGAVGIARGDGIAAPVAAETGRPALRGHAADSRLRKARLASGSADGARAASRSAARGMNAPPARPAL